MFKECLTSKLQSVKESFSICVKQDPFVPLFLCNDKSAVTNKKTDDVFFRQGLEYGKEGSSMPCELILVYMHCLFCISEL